MRWRGNNSTYFNENDWNGTTAQSLKSCIGKEILFISLQDDQLTMYFTDGTGIAIYDDGQQCCEYRYTSTDDDLQYHVGAKFIGIELKDGGVEDLGDVEEIQFLDLRTTNGVFQLVNHNNHNGYYSGFGVYAELLNTTIRA